MAEQKRKRVVFVEVPGTDLGRLAAAKFDAVAAKLGLPFAGVVHVAGQPLEAAALVLLNGADLVPLPAAVERWHIQGDVAAGLEREVSGLIARLLGGRTVAEPASQPVKKEPPKKVFTVRVGRETAGRRGKGVTTVFDLPMNEDAMKELAATLKAKCGTGGTVKDRKIEIQGDHRDRIVAELEKLGYKVKRSGG